MSPETSPATPTTEQVIEICLQGVARTSECLDTGLRLRQPCFRRGQTIIADLNATNFMHDPARVKEQIWVLDTLQKLAYSETDQGGVFDISAWCSSNWLMLLQRESRNVAILKGIGQGWLWKAQPALARIHQSEGSPSSSSGSSNLSARSITAIENEEASATQRRLSQADHVEARALLQPATEYLGRAVTEARTQEVMTGEILAITAEAYMSLGNVSDPRFNQTYFQRSIYLLREATTVPGYFLNTHLQHYLDEYGRFIDS